MIVLALLLAVLATDPPAEASAAEDRRLPARVLRKRLQELGLVDLLELHLQLLPPDRPLEAHTQGRQLALLQYGRQDLSTAERLAAAERASNHLRALIDAYPDHEGRFMWRLDLGRDLIDRQAEPFYNNIMFRGGTDDDRTALAELTSEAIDVYADLIAELIEIEQQIDDMSISEFERMTRNGQIDQIEQLLPRARYLSMWANYYHCLTLQSRDPRRIELLNKVITYLTQESQLVDTPHNMSNYQAQSLLLAGMAYRLLNSSDRAEVLLDRAAGVAGTLPDVANRHRLQWVVTLAELERVRNFRDSRDYDRALRTISRYRSRLRKDDPQRFNIEYALALLEGTVCRAQAEDLPPNQERRRGALLLRARQPLIELAEEHPRYRNEIYSQVYEDVATDTADADLDSFEKNIVAARLLRQASDIRVELQGLAEKDDGKRMQELRQEQNTLLHRAVNLAFRVLEDTSPLARKLHAEARFNIAVCYHVQGQVLAAIEQFNLVVDDHPDFERRQAAAVYAARLAEGLYARTAPSVRKSLREPVLQAIHGLVTEYPHVPESAQRLFVYGRILQDAGRFADAAAQYDLVPQDDPRYSAALLHKAQCDLQLARAEDNAETQSRSIYARRAREAAEAFSVLTDPVTQHTGWADAQLIVAEATLLDPRRGASEALEVLDQANDAIELHPQLIGRAMRLRILAYQDLGLSDQAASIIPGYIQRDPTRAGATLQGLLEVLNDEIEQARANKRTDVARKKALDAVIVARELSRWASSSASQLSTAARTALQLEYAESLMRTTREQDIIAAYDIFSAVVAKDAASRTDGEPRNARAIQGLAESAMASEHYAEALPHFSRLHRLSPENSDVWWTALLGEVRCRAALDQDAQMLYNLIEQKKAFFPKMGGSQMRRNFQRLQQELKSKIQR